MFPANGYFNERNLRAIHTYYPRTVSSLTSFLAGFYPPPAKDKSMTIPWQAIPFGMDMHNRIIIQLDDSCPAYTAKLQRERDQFIQSNFTQWALQERTLLRRISAEVGVPLDDFLSISTVAEIILVNRDYDPKIPKWMVDAGQKMINYLMGYYYGLPTLNSEYGRMVTGGNLIGQILDNLVAIRDGNKAAAVNFQVYSGHDYSVHIMAKLLQVGSQLPAMINYADTLAVELIESVSRGKSAWTVQVMYVNGLTLKKTILVIPKCGKSCSLDQFIAEFSRFRVKDWDALCKV